MFGLSLLLITTAHRGRVFLCSNLCSRNFVRFSQVTGENEPLGLAAVNMPVASFSDIVAARWEVVMVVTCHGVCGGNDDDICSFYLSTLGNLLRHTAVVE